MCATSKGFRSLSRLAKIRPDRSSPVPAMHLDCVTVRVQCIESNSEPLRQDRCPMPTKLRGSRAGVCAITNIVQTSPAGNTAGPTAGNVPVEMTCSEILQPFPSVSWLVIAGVYAHAEEVRYHAVPNGQCFVDW